MAKVNASLLAYNRGEVSKSALARVDNEKLRLAAECQVNWLPAATGRMMLRPGMGYLGFSTRSDAASYPIPFIFGFSDTALLELTDSHLRVIVNDALVTRASVSTSVTNGDFSSGTGWTLANTAGCTADINSTVSGALYLAAVARGGVVSCLRSVSVSGGDSAVLHAFRIVVTKGPVTFMCGTTSGGAELIARTKLDTGTHSLTCTPGTTTIYVKFESQNRRASIVDSITVESSGTLDLPAPWLAADLTGNKIRYDQSGDVVFIACDGYQQRKIERRDNNSWGVVLYESDDGPFSFADTQDVTLTPSVYEGNGTLTASSSLFRSTDTGKLFRIVSSGQTKQAILGAVGAASETLRVSGVDASDRGFSHVISGTWVGTIALERSVEGPDVAFKEVATYTSNATTAIDDHATFANVIVWYRLSFKAYTSGSATVKFTGTTSVIDLPNLGGGKKDESTSTSTAVSLGSTAGICRVTSYTSATVVNIEVLKPVAEVTASSSWMPGDWNATGGYPTETKFSEGRLWFFRGDRRWASVSDDYYSFDLESVGDSGTINRSFGSGPIGKINFALDLTRLIIGREMSIDPVRTSTQDEPVTPTNHATKACSTKGAAALPALKVGTRGMYVEKSGARIYELLYNVDAQDYVANDLTRLNDEIGLPGFSSLAVQEQSYTYLHFVRADGEDAILLYDPGDEIKCWFRFMTLGTIERVVVLPGTIEDSVYYVVNRTINGSTKRFWEKMALKSQCVGATLSRNMDCYVSISQASSTTVSGLSHLEGETVCVWANGKDLGTYTVSSGAITTSEAITTAIVGLGGTSFSYDSSSASASVTAASKYNGYPAEVFACGPNGGEMKYVGTVTVAAGAITLPNGRTAKKIMAYLGLYAPFRSAKLAYAAQMGTALAQSKKVEEIGLIMFDTHYQGLQYGSGIDNLQPLPLTEGGVDTAADTVWTEFDRPMIGLSGDWDTDKRLHLLAQAPRPCSVAGAVVAVITRE